MTIAGVGLLLALVKASSHVLAFTPGLLLIGLGIGVMLTPSVNIVQSSFAEQKQGEISGLSRSVSNLGSSLGTAIAGTILVSDLVSGNRSYVLAMAALAALALVGLAAAVLLPRKPPTAADQPERAGHPRAGDGSWARIGRRAGTPAADITRTVPGDNSAGSATIGGVTTNSARWAGTRSSTNGSRRAGCSPSTGGRSTKPVGVSVSSRSGSAPAPASTRRRSSGGSCPARRRG